MKKWRITIEIEEISGGAGEELVRLAPAIFLTAVSQALADGRLNSSDGQKLLQEIETLSRLTEKARQEPCEKGSHSLLTAFQELLLLERALRKASSPKSGLKGCSELREGKGRGLGQRTCFSSFNPCPFRNHNREEV